MLATFITTLKVEGSLPLRVVVYMYHVSGSMRHFFHGVFGDETFPTITAAPVLIPYHPECPILIICDGSPEGLGGGLFQKNGKGFQPVH